MLTFSSKPRSLRTRRQPDSSPGAGLAPLSSQLCAIDEPMDSELPEETVSRKGWHDSSNELKRGLDVIEDVPFDALPPELRAPFATRRC